MAGVPPLCVKELRWRGRIHALKGMFRSTQGERTFRNGWKLYEAGVSVPLPLAFVRRVGSGLVKSEWVVMQVIEDALELDRYLVSRISAEWSHEERAGLVRLFGRFLGMIHAKGIFHADLKTCNILVSEDPPDPEDVSQSGTWRPLNPCRPVRFSLVDYDHVVFGARMPVRKRVKNLVQICRSTPKALRATDRLRFLNEYALHTDIAPKERRALAQQILEAVRGKEILYVGFDGDVVERWEEA
jgi:serine/threonine protein kinase